VPDFVKFVAVRRSISLLIVTATSLFGQAAPSNPAGPVYDPSGHLIAYVYPDGKKETYAYDSQWRMIKFRDRGGKLSTFSYAPDGSLTVSQPKSGSSNQ
jgi:YD repeat-containing protein